MSNPPVNNAIKRRPVPSNSDDISSSTQIQPYIKPENVQPYELSSPYEQNPLVLYEHSNTSQLPKQPLTSSSISPQPWTRFAIPTKNDSLSSGFPFHHRLYNLKVTHDEWHRFSSDIVEGGKVNGTQDFLAWTTGITAGTLTSPFLFVLAPVVGYYSGRAVHRMGVVKTVKEKLLQEGDLRSILRRWNEQTFMPKGFQAWLELPRDPEELHQDMTETTLEAKRPKDQKKIARKAAKRFRIIIIPNDDGNDFESTRSGGSSTAVADVMDEEQLQALELQRRRFILPPPPMPDLSNEPPAYRYSNTEAGLIAPEAGDEKKSLEAREARSFQPDEVRYSRPDGFTNT